MDWLVSILLGAAGGNIAGEVIKKISLGNLWNSVVGILGGGIGAFLLGLLNIEYLEPEWLWRLITALIGGAVLLWIVSLFKK
ncbi:GlsB/YeaQ/YmgE family stress response membrane protein [Candidatus Neomarinimicrobiota bacterium]